MPEPDGDEEPEVPLSVPLVPELPDEPAAPVPEVPDESMLPEEPEVPDESMLPEEPEVPVEPEAPLVPDVPLEESGQKQEALSVPEAPEVPVSAAPLVPLVPLVLLPLVVPAPGVAPVTSLAPLVVDESDEPEPPLDSTPPTGVSGSKAPVEPSGQVQLAVELPVAPLEPEVPAGSEDEPELVVPLAAPEGDVPLIPEPLPVAGSLLPEVVLPPEVVLLSVDPPEVP